jgi:hypothetical protein
VGARQGAHREAHVRDRRPHVVRDVLIHLVPRTRVTTACGAATRHRGTGRAPPSSTTAHLSEGSGMAPNASEFTDRQRGPAREIWRKMPPER